MKKGQFLREGHGETKKQALGTSEKRKEMARCLWAGAGALPKGLGQNADAEVRTRDLWML